MAELRGLGEVQAELTRRGGRVWAVAVDPPELASKVADKIGLGFDVLCDTDRKIINAFGLVHQGGGLDGGDVAVPAHVLIDSTGRIAWRHVARKIQDRPHPATVLQAIDGLK